MLLGLERLLAEEPPKLRDGAELNPHQVDALSGTLTELMAEQQVAAENGAEPPSADGAGSLEEADEEEELAPDEEEPQDWVEPAAEGEEIS